MKYYNSHGYKMTWAEFIDIEVEERRNYPPDEVYELAQKYNIARNTKCIWVCENKWDANGYNLPAQDWDEREDVPEEDLSVCEYDESEGFIIKETDDGDGGYLFVFNWKGGYHRLIFILTQSDKLYLFQV